VCEKLPWPLGWVCTGLEPGEYFAVGPVIIGELAAQMIEKFHELRCPRIRAARRIPCSAESPRNNFTL
jgi:hypothetical protein